MCCPVVSVVSSQRAPVLTSAGAGLAGLGDARLVEAGRDDQAPERISRGEAMPGAPDAELDRHAASDPLGARLQRAGEHRRLMGTLGAVWIVTGDAARSGHRGALRRRADRPPHRGGLRGGDDEERPGAVEPGETLPSARREVGVPPQEALAGLRPPRWC